MIKLVFATNNAHKLEEVKAMLGAEFDLLSLADIGCTADIPETGDTFEHNAQQKSDYVVNHFQMDCFADDSGLEIDALDGEPGVYSAHYSGTRDMDTNIALVLQKLGDNPDRTARFRTVISLSIGGEQHFFDGSVEGHIIANERGGAGFGYDPIFIPQGYEQTFAEMTAEQKNKISHRAVAVEKLVAFLRGQ
ncbi:non-canonical purine NTP diphosphatase [Sphingobacterium corticibacter]|uniref:dITP/XTP pyrophosphatase n=1 Tax=Sphingobacterium corticibacter TaxID=2171749 RepID=A0A2T8HL60_9SPHI|nr:non-canonical purine NTP diphosphatase [Sphingobacterium corticibacter]PVH26130.1 non-canonical purine NTP pyrophosphatase [Sphingobacterium corticibacter]